MSTPNEVIGLRMNVKCYEFNNSLQLAGVIVHPLVDNLIPIWT